MPNKKNIQLADELTEKLSHANGAVFVDYKGLTHRNLEELRLSIEEVGGSLHITKNTILKLSIEKSSDVSNLDRFEGPTATVFLPDDIVGPIKKLTEYIKQNDLPTIKSGLVNHAYVDATYITNLSLLPSHDQLIANLLRQLGGPAYGVVSVLSANLRSLVYALDAIKTTKGGEQNG